MPRISIPQSSKGFQTSSSGQSSEPRRRSPTFSRGRKSFSQLHDDGQYDDSDEEDDVMFRNAASSSKRSPVGKDATAAAVMAARNEVSFSAEKTPQTRNTSTSTGRKKKAVRRKGAPQPMQLDESLEVGLGSVHSRAPSPSNRSTSVKRGTRAGASAGAAPLHAPPEEGPPRRSTSRPRGHQQSQSTQKRSSSRVSERRRPSHHQPLSSPSSTSSTSPYTSSSATYDDDTDDDYRPSPRHSSREQPQSTQRHRRNQSRSRSRSRPPAERRHSSRQLQPDPNQRRGRSSTQPPPPNDKRRSRSASVQRHAPSPRHADQPSSRKSQTNKSSTPRAIAERDSTSSTATTRSSSTPPTTRDHPRMRSRTPSNSRSTSTPKPRSSSMRTTRTTKESTPRNTISKPSAPKQRSVSDQSSYRRAMTPANAEAAAAAVAARQQKRRRRPRTFQDPADGLGAYVRMVELSCSVLQDGLPSANFVNSHHARTAGGMPMSRLPRELLVHAGTMHRLTSANPRRREDAAVQRVRKLSPAPAHVQVLDAVMRQEVARQVTWSAGVSSDAQPIRPRDLMYGRWSWSREELEGDDEEGEDGFVDDLEGDDGFLEEEDGGKEGRLSSTSSDGGESSARKSGRGRSTRAKDPRGLYDAIRLEDHLASLPKKPPRLTNRRPRLPIRSDVGFPRATEEEVRLKQEEIAAEAELEEACPRLAVLVSASDLGRLKALAEPTGSSQKAAEGPFLSSYSSSHSSSWPAPSSSHVSSTSFFSPKNGGNGTNGQPLGGGGAFLTPVPSISPISGSSSTGSPLTEEGPKPKRTVEKQHSSSQLPQLQPSQSPKSPPSMKSRRGKRRPNPTSIFAPALASVPSNKHASWGWRPPHAGPEQLMNMAYIAASPIDVRFDAIGDFEPLVCSLALYYLPEVGAGGGMASGSSSSFASRNTSTGKPIPQGGKISEDFTFPAGDWESVSPSFGSEGVSASTFDIEVNYSYSGKRGGKRSGKTSPRQQHHTEPCSSGVGLDDMPTEQMWRKWKRKAVFSFDASLVPHGGMKSLFFVMQVNKVSHAGAMLPYAISCGGGADGNASVTSKQSNSSSVRKVKRLSRKLGLSGGGGSGAGGGGSVGARALISSSSSASSFRGIGGGSRSGDQNDVVTSARMRAAAVFDNFGTQLLTPICFGIVPVTGSSIDSGGWGFKTDTGTEDELSKKGIEQVMSWPSGDQQTMDFYAFPSQPLTQQEFIERLVAIRKPFSTCLDATGGPPSSPTSMKSASSFPTPSSPIVNLSPSGKFKFRHIGGLPDHGSGSLCAATDSAPISGRAVLFTSFLGMDMTKVLGSTPAALFTPQNFPEEARKSGEHFPELGPMMPKTIIDASGDSAVSVNMDGADRQHSEKRTPGGRAPLTYLPSPSEPAGYASDANGFREVLYMPTRSDGVRSPDVPLFSRRFLNLLYVYPRLMTLVESETTKREKDKRGKSSKFLSVRVRLVRETSSEGRDGDGFDADFTANVIDAIYNPAPNGGPLLKAFYTKIPHGGVPHGKRSGGSKSHQAPERVAMRDEVKVRLPLVLDDSYFLEFSLFSIRLTDQFDLDGGITAEALAETRIPLSNSSSRENGSRTRVATVIPDDTHRVKLGQYVLHVETRLVSSIHVSDPSLAAFVRDFPFTVAVNEKGVIPSISNGLGGNITLTGPRGKSSFRLGDCPFSAVLAKASEQALTNHIHVLLFMHFSNLINNGAPAFDFSRVAKLFGHEDEDYAYESGAMASTVFSLMQESLVSLFELVRKVKLKFWSDNYPLDDGSSKKGGKFLAFLKHLTDIFDENVFSIELHDARSDRSEANQIRGDLYHPTNAARGFSSASVSSDAGDSGNQLISPSQFDFQVDLISETVVDIMEDKLLEAAVNVVAQQQRSSFKTRRDSDLLYSQESSSSPVDAPFARKAYGVSKIDRMRAEAEFDEDVSRQLMDDDQTVITAATWHDQNKTEKATFDALVDMDSPHRRGRSIRNLYEHSNFGTDEEEIKVDMTPKTGPIKPSLKRGKSDGSTSYFFNNERAKSIRERLPNMPGLGGENSLSKRVNSVAQVFIAPCMAPVVDVGVPGMIRQSHTAAPATESSNERKSTLPQDMRGRSKNAENRTKICSPGSDIDDETDEDEVHLLPKRSEVRTSSWAFPNEPKSKLRGSQRLLELVGPLELSFPSLENGGVKSENRRPYFYESIFVLWLEAWMEDSGHDEKEQAESRDDKSVRHPMLPQSRLSHSYLVHIDFLLPLCLKSIALRCSEQAGLLHQNTRMRTSILSPTLDARHMQLLVPLVGVWAQGLMNVAREGTKAKEAENVTMLASALQSCDVVVDFFIGLLAIIHHAQVSVLIGNFFEIFRVEEEDSLDRKSSSDEFFRLMGSRHLRLRAIEKLATIPGFVALNYPLKYPTIGRRTMRRPATWTHQILDDKTGVEESSVVCPFPDGLERLPKTHWLAELLTDEAFSICAASCETILLETVHQDRPPSISRNDLRRLQSMAIDSVGSAYELLLRRHAVDERFQSDEARSRIAAMFVRPVFQNSVQAVPWLSRMEATHKVRLFWLLCLLHVLQEAPEFLIREQLRIFCDPKAFRLHKFVRLLKLCNSTFQCFIGSKDDSKELASYGLSTWIVQESFNIICAATNMLVDECCDAMLTMPVERKRLAQGLLNLLLHVITTPQSPVTHLRALGGASQALDKFGAGLFLEVVGDSLQHWARLVLTLMNSTALSVRSIAVDFIVSLLGGIYDEEGTIDEISLVLLTVMPEVVAREIGMYSVSDKILTMSDAECSLWPLRRALAEVEDADPIDDDRVDTQLAPFLATLCRSCQAVIDGVLIELRLQGDNCTIAERTVQCKSPTKMEKFAKGATHAGSSAAWLGQTFDADEESIYEAANSFLPETAPLQRLRWLMTLKSLHESKCQWVEAAETLLLCARTIADAVPHIQCVWRPSRFLLWHDTRLSLWLRTVGYDGRGARLAGNAEIMMFADQFLEPHDLLAGAVSSARLMDYKGKLYQPTVAELCRMLTKVSKEVVQNYLKEDGVESIAFLRLENLLKNVMGVVENFSTVAVRGRHTLFGASVSSGKELVEETAALRKMSASLNGDMTKIAERMLFLAGESDPNKASRANHQGQPKSPVGTGSNMGRRQYYVRVLMVGKKPDRFKESTTIPTFLEWASPSICRVPRNAVHKALLETNKDKKASLRGTDAERLCAAFAEPLLEALRMEVPASDIVFCSQPPSESVLAQEGEKKTFLVVTLVRTGGSTTWTGIGSDGDETMTAGAKRFFFRSQVQSPANSLRRASSASVKSWTTGIVESTVAQRFPCALSRQRSIITSEFLSGATDNNGLPLYQC